MIDVAAIVLSSIKVPGGITCVKVQTSMVSTMVDHTHPTLMV